MADIFNLTDTWNNGASVFSAIKMDVTDTASDATSMLLDLRVAGSPKVSIRKDARIFLYNSYTDPSNYERGFIRYVANALEIGHEGAGTGVNSRTVNFITNGSAYFTINTSGFAINSNTTCGGAFTLNGSFSTLGYAAGSGGAVTQITSRTTGVTLDRGTGAITLISAAGSAAWQSFTVTNARVAATDVVVVCQKSGADKYMIEVTNVAAGSFQISYATTGGTTTEQPVFNFVVLKGAAS